MRKNFKSSLNLNVLIYASVLLSGLNLFYAGSRREEQEDNIDSIEDDTEWGLWPLPVKYWCVPSLVIIIIPPFPRI